LTLWASRVSDEVGQAGSLSDRPSGPYWWAALYQQRPAPPEGNLFKREWFLYFTEEPHGDDTLYVKSR